jgi:glucose-6-phosphate isomerase
MIKKAKFVFVTRVIDSKTGIHYLDAVDTNGQHWMAEMSHKIEPHLCYTEGWYADPQQPYQ